MSLHKPAFTIVIPLYNAERYISQAIDSVLAQTFADFEVVVVDDASTDGGPAIVRSYINEDSRIRMVRQKNRGLAGARNTGIRNARGRFIALLDADDAFLPEKLQRHYAHLRQNPEIGVSYAPSLFMNDDGDVMSVSQRPRLDAVDADYVFCRNPVGNGSAAVLRREALDDIVFDIDALEGNRPCWFDETFRQSEDIECWTRIAATTTWKFGGIAEPLTLYRVNTNGLSAKVDKQYETWCRFRDKMARIAPDLVARSGKRSEAYQLRYLARRAAIGGDGWQALGLVARSLHLHPMMLVEETGRTLVTAGFSTVSALCPPRYFAALKRVVLERASGHAAPQSVRA